MNTTPYARITRHGHPLASVSGSVLEHRFVLYERIGPGEHPCHWCARVLRWTPGEKRADSLLADHVDENSRNNAPGNIVPSCYGCNAWRSHGGTLRADDRMVQLSSGHTRAAEITCVECGKTVLTRKVRADSQQFCSRACQASAANRTSGHAVRNDELFINRVGRGGICSRVRAGNVTCQGCGTSFLAALVRIKKRTAKFCSKRCGGKVAGRHTNHARGENNANTNATEAVVREMRGLWDAGGITLIALGERFNMSKAGASGIVHRRSWKHVT